MKNNLNLAFLIGTRPELIKIFPVYQNFIEESRHQITLISTGQHKEQLNKNLEVFKIKTDIDLKLMKKNQTWTGFLFEAIPKIELELKKTKPDFLFVQGDTVSALAGAIVSNYLKIPLGHIEAGLRTHSEDEPFPEEINRKLIAQMTTLNFAPTEKAKTNLLAEKIPDNKVFVTGNTIVDSVNHMGFEKCKNYLQNNKVLVTLHRQDSIPYLPRILEKIARFANSQKNLEFIFPLHLNPKIRSLVEPVLEPIGNIKIIEQTSYKNLLEIMKKSMFVISDSGGIQEEAAILNIPLAVARDLTERQESLDEKISILLGRNSENFKKNLDSFFQKIQNQKINFEKNPYGDGDASKRISNIVHKFCGLKQIHKNINPEYKAKK